MDIIFEKIKQAKLKGSPVLKLTLDEAKLIYAQMAEYHKNNVPAFERWLETAYYFGFKVKIYEQKSDV